ncbi:hypothetical protein SDC9_147692 [bioreactor metagenome]|uniref:Uncharacterized protein n=1 Tax=bioreactor metagenome TaxID=1076179 RepID=A0A645EFE3_9ZZZZ
MIDPKLAQISPVRGFDKIFHIVGFAGEQVGRFAAADRGGELREEFGIRHDGNLNLDVRVDGVEAFHKAGEFLAGGPNGDAAAQRGGVNGSLCRFGCGGFGCGLRGIRGGCFGGGGGCAGKHGARHCKRQNQCQGLFHGFSPPFLC